MDLFESLFYFLYPVGGIVIAIAFLSPVINHIFDAVSKYFDGRKWITSALFTIVSAVFILTLNSTYIHNIFSKEYLSNDEFIVDPATIAIPLIASAKHSDDIDMLFYAAQKLHISSRYREAKTLYEKAAKRGHALAAYNLGALYCSNSLSIDAEENLINGYFYLLLASELKVVLPANAQAELGQALQSRQQRIPKDKLAQIHSSVSALVKSNINSRGSR